MRLVNAKTVTLDEYLDSDAPEYAILSHTWGEEEVTFQDMQGSILKPRRKRGWNKIKHACDQSLRDGHTHIWVDTCCIDKSSSAELQEAINSMYRWYSNARVCYSYLFDVNCPRLDDSRAVMIVPGERDEVEVTGSQLTHWHSMFMASKWFTRGWTLQELIAPDEVWFFGTAWDFIGTKGDLVKTVAKVTGIERSVLIKRTSVSSVSVAKRMSWAAYRETSRLEDRAYSLLGLFEINMPMLYGEGVKAFTRLQEEIIRTSTDNSIFAWERTAGSPTGALLADSPARFAACKEMVQWGQSRGFEMTNRGLRMDAQIIQRLPAAQNEDEGVIHAVLNCRPESNFDRTFALRLRKYPNGEEYHPVVGVSWSMQNARLVLVEGHRLRDAERRTLQITKTFEPEKLDLRFLVRAMDGDLERRASQVYPEDLWDLSSGIVHVKKQPRVRAGLIYEGLSGAKYTVVFGFDHEDWSYEHGIIPGVWVEEEVALGSLSRHCESHRGCESHGITCATKCPRMSRSAFAVSRPSTEMLSVSIRVDILMEEIVVVVSVQAQAVHELEAWSRVPFPELDAVDTERSELMNPHDNVVSQNYPQIISEALEKSRQKREIFISTVVRPLNRLVGPSAVDQVFYIRFMTALGKHAMPEVVDNFPSESWHQLADLTWFTIPFEGLYFKTAESETIAGVAFKLTNQNQCELVVIGGSGRTSKWGVLVSERTTPGDLESDVHAVDTCQRRDGLCGSAVHNRSHLLYNQVELESVRVTMRQAAVEPMTYVIDVLDKSEPPRTSAEHISIDDTVAEPILFDVLEKTEHPVALSENGPTNSTTDGTVLDSLTYYTLSDNSTDVV